MTFVVDFDGTCVTHEYPNVGKDIGAAPVLKRLSDKGHKIILFTMRSEPVDDVRGTLQEAVDWFKNKNIPLYGINENPSQHSWTSSPKAHGNLYFDDHAFGAPIKKNAKGDVYYDWTLVADFFRRLNIFSESEYDEIAEEIKNEIENL